ncbi:MAG: hypothetical protein ACIAS6_07455 [Phycisphaerales bacterium JB060]
MRTQSYLLVLPLAALAAGCAVSPGYEIVPTDGPGVLGPVPGDRDDIPRALLVGLESAEAAMLQGRWQGDTYDASFLIVESREGAATAIDHGDGTFTLRAFIEPHGDRIAQQELLEAWAHRLGQLHGVEWAPR